MSSPLPEFVSALLARGEVAVVRNADLTLGEDDTARLLADAFDDLIADLPGGGDAIAFDAASAVTAARYLYRLCLALADRAMAEHKVLDLCVAVPILKTPAAVLSADLVLRHLPEVFRMARAISENDPLVAGLCAAGVEVPLSTVGLPLTVPPDLTLLRGHPGLWRYYLDRVLERQDEARLADPAVRAAIQDALGLHPRLAPRLAAQLALTDA